MREKLNMPFWRQQLREEISPAQVIPDWNLRCSPLPKTLLPVQPVRTLGKGISEPTAPRQKHAQPVANGDSERWTVPRDMLMPLERPPSPKPRNVHRDTLAPLGRSSLLPRTPAQHYKSYSNDGAQVPAPPACVPDMSLELRVDGVVAGKRISFIVDTGATFSLSTSYSGLTQDSELTIKGVSGVPLRPKIRPPLLCQFGKSTLIHTFLIMPKCPVALLGRQLLSKLGIFITILPPLIQSIFCMQMAPGPSLSLTPNFPLDLPTLDPQVWDTDHPSIAKHHPPVHITLKDPSTIITQQQYYLTPEAHKRLKPIIDRLLQASILIPTHSPQTPLFWQ